MKLKQYEGGNFLKTPEAIVEYLNLALESGDHEVFLKALGNAAKAKGMTDVSNKTNIERTTLYRALSGDQDTGTGVALKVLQALDIKLTLEPATKARVT
ncbi:putative addiction module antidote protein [Pseudomonadales bacterium]|nr:putative addiction module antidote protein [Pseudomonadales bacterium]